MRETVFFASTPILDIVGEGDQRPTAFRARHPRVEVEIDIEDRFVDIVAEGYDAGVRVSEAFRSWWWAPRATSRATARP